MNIFSLIAQKQDLGGIESFGGYGGPQGGALNPGDTLMLSSDVGPSASALEKIVSNALGFLTVVAGISFLIYFAIGGLTWITSGGDKGKVDEAKSRMTGAAIGMIIIVSAWAITWIVGRVLGLNDIFNLQKVIPTLGPS